MFTVFFTRCDYNCTFICAGDTRVVMMFYSDVFSVFHCCIDKYSSGSEKKAFETVFTPDRVSTIGCLL